MLKAYTVIMDVPEDATDDEGRYYIERAIKGWRGQLLPPDPMCNLEPSSVVVRGGPKTDKRFVVGDASYGRSETEQLRGELIVLRDEALKQGDADWSVALSHMVGLWYAMILDIWGDRP